MPITITATPAVNPGGVRTANHFGVGEVITLAAAIAPAPPRPPVWRWDVTSGADRGHFSASGNQARLILLSVSDGSMSIRVRNTWDDSQATLTITIVAPSNWSMGPPQYLFHLGGMAHAAFRAAVQVRNNHNVSFDNLEMREGNAMPERMGRYITDNVNANNHHHATFNLASNWIGIGAARANLGLQAAASPNHVAIAIDRVGSHPFGPPFTAGGNAITGSFTWRIPWTYRLAIPVASLVDIHGAPIQAPDAGIRQANNVVTHLESLNGNSMTISKGGQAVTYNATQAGVGNAATFNA